MPSEVSTRTSDPLNTTWPSASITAAFVAPTAPPTFPSASNVGSSLPSAVSRATAYPPPVAVVADPASTTRPSASTRTAYASSELAPPWSIGTRALPPSPNVGSSFPSAVSRTTAKSRTGNRTGNRLPPSCSPTTTDPARTIRPSGSTLIARAAARSNPPTGNEVVNRPSPSNVLSSEPSGFSRAAANLPSLTDGSWVTAKVGCPWANPARTIFPSGRTATALATSTPAAPSVKGMTASPSASNVGSSFPSAVSRTTAKSADGSPV